jgi:hypothetical protein
MKPAATGARPRRYQPGRIDARSKEARLLRRLRADMVKHLGREPSVIEAGLIERCCWLELRLRQLNEKLATGTLTEHDHNYYLAWSNAYARTAARLGLEPASAKSAPGAALDAHLAALAASRSEAAA